MFNKEALYLDQAPNFFSLHTAGEEHHTDLLANGSGREVAAEDHADLLVTPSQSAYSAVASVGAHHLTPDSAVVSTVLHGRSLHQSENMYKSSQTPTYLVDVDNALTEVELGVLLGIHSFHLNKVLVGVLENLRSTG